MKYLLSLCILLLSVHSQLYAQPGQGFAGISLTKGSVGSGLAGYGTLQADQASKLRYFSPGTDESLRLEATDIEEEEDESVSFKKILASGDYFAAALYSLLLALFFCHFKTGLRHCKQFSHNSSKRRFLLFQVFRI